MSRTRNKVSREVRGRAVRLGLDREAERSSRWPAIEAIAPKIGCSANTLNAWITRAEVNAGRRGGVPTGPAETMTALEGEKRKLRQANESLRKGEPLSARDGVDGSRSPHRDGPPWVRSQTDRGSLPWNGLPPSGSIWPRPSSSYTASTRPARRS